MKTSIKLFEVQYGFDSVKSSIKMFEVNLDYDTPWKKKISELSNQPVLCA